MGKTINLHGFPSGQTADQIKEFLERYTGEGSVFALKLRPAKSGGRYYAIIQFQSAIHADKIVALALASTRLWYGRSYLKAHQAPTDIVPKPRTFMHSLQGLVLHVGCQVAKNKFSVLWHSTEVSVDFGFKLRNLQFRLLYHQKLYRLQLSYENIWQIELHHPRGSSAKYLVIQLYGSPRIYLQEASYSEVGYEGMNYFRDPDEWVRTTDFTPRKCIGQSSSLCLVLPSDGELPDFEENFAYYKKSDKQFILENCATFSCNLDLVPIVGSPAEIDLPYDILFKINSLVQWGCVSGPALDNSFYRLMDPRRINNRLCIEFALDKLSNLKECCYEPALWLNEEYRKYMTSKRPPKPAHISLDSGLVYVRRVQITPCKVYFSGPEVNVSNRVLRQYSSDIDNFLRVSFVDEEMEKLYSTDLSPRTCTTKTRIYNRVLSVLRDGIVIGNKKFKFLAFSSSQLRENSLWMFASTDEVSADTIRAGMGNFRKIRNVAKYAARLGQSFGSSTETLSVGRNEMEVIPDVTTVNRYGVEYVFSDGIGKISVDFAARVAKKCGYKAFTPSAFQIRYGGYKGVVVVDPKSSMKLSLRKSMSKYESENTKLDVLACSKYQPCFLNRQLITLLSTLEVQDHVFLKKQRAAVQQLDAMLTDPLKAEEALDLMSAGESTNVLKELLKCGYKPNVEPFLSMMLQTFRASKLLELRTKARIFIPHGRAMMGCLDETGTLEYGQVFVHFSGSRRRQLFDDICIYDSSDDSFIIERKVVVAKNPCLHPGDVRVLDAVDVPELHHMVDCVVFPQKGHRPHPNECSGSDLDGDIYFVCWDPELIPRKQIQPMDYSPAPTLELDHDVTIENVEEYFVNYIVNDSLGIIANAHTVFADKEYAKAMSQPCIELAKLFSIAVDFPKTGVPAVIPQELYAKEYPDFMEKPNKRTYISENVIGKLFREVKDIAPHDNLITAFTCQVAASCYDPDMEVEDFEAYLDDAFYYKGTYDYKLGNMLDYYGIKTEAEILSGNVMTMSKSFTKRRDADAINMAVKSLRKEARAWFNEKGTGVDSGGDDVYAKASAWYHVTYHPSYHGLYNEGMNRPHFISFPWCVFDKLAHIKKEKVNQARPVSFLEERFRYGLQLS